MGGRPLNYALDVMDSTSLLESVCNEASFLAFVRALLADRESDPSSWENDSIETYLRASLSWAEDSSFGIKQGLANASVWKRAAVFLYVGKIYE